MGAGPNSAAGWSPEPFELEVHAAMEGAGQEGGRIVRNRSQVGQGFQIEQEIEAQCGLVERHEWSQGLAQANTSDERDDGSVQARPIGSQLDLESQLFEREQAFRVDKLGGQ